MTDDNRRIAVGLELRHARQALAAARALRGLSMGNDAVSRLYCALFHFVGALLLTEGIDVTRHQSVPRLLGLHFVLTGKLTSADVAIVGRALTTRSLADYERTWDATPDIVDAAFAEVEPLIEKVEAMLAASGFADAR